MQETPKEMRDVLEQAVRDARDYANEPATQMLCKLLSDLTAITDIQKFEEKPTLWQLNWVEVAWPTGDTLLKKDLSALWFQTSLRDISGQVLNVWMDEKSALSLAQLDDKEAFLQANTEGKQLFPIMASVKVTRAAREVKTSEEASDVPQLAGAKTVRLVVVHGNDQPWDEAPTKATLELLPMMRDFRDDTSAILPAPLHMVESSPHYAFTVTCTPPGGSDPLIMPCQKVLALIRSSKNSKPTSIGDGFKLVTPEVEDLLHLGEPTNQSPSKYTLSAMCTLENLPAYRLDPPRGGCQHALVTITCKTADAFIVESVQLLNAEEALLASHSLQQMLYLAMHIHSRDRKRAAVEWTEDFSPFAARKCSRLGRYPTDGGMPDP